MVRILGTRLVLLAGAASAALALSGCATDPESEKAEAAPVVAEAERKAWDAEEMTRLSAELMRAVRNVRDAWRKEPAFRDPQSPQRASSMRLDQNLRSLDQRTTQLASRVKGGGGYDETINIARNIRTLLNDIDMNARGIMTSEWMDEQIQPAMVLINEIAAYYGSDALFDPETLQRTDRPPRRR